MAQLTRSAQAKTCLLRKKGFTEEEIWKYLGEHGYFKKKSEEKKTKEDVNVNANDHTTINNIDEETYKRYLIKCINGQGNIRVCTEIRNYLDKTAQIKKVPISLLPPNEADAAELIN